MTELRHRSLSCMDLNMGFMNLPFYRPWTHKPRTTGSMGYQEANTLTSKRPPAGTHPHKWPPPGARPQAGLPPDPDSGQAHHFTKISQTGAVCALHWTDFGFFTQDPSLGHPLNTCPENSSQEVLQCLRGRHSRLDAGASVGILEIYYFP